MSARIGNSFLVLLGCPFRHNPHIVHNARPPCSLLKCMSRVDACVCYLKKNIDFLLFYDFVPEIYTKKNNDNNNTEINGMKFKRGCFDKIDWNTWMPDWDVNENKRLEIGSTGSFSGVLIFSFFIFSLFFWLYLKLWISCVNDGKRPFFFLIIIIILPWQLRQTIKRRYRRFLSKIQTVCKATVSFGQIKPEKIVFWIFGLKRTILDQKSKVLIKVQIIEVFPRD